MYDKIVGPNRVNSNISNAYVFVLPKSGTVYLGVFFRVYSDLLNGKSPGPKQFTHQNCKKHLFGKNDFAVEHSECPGFRYVEKDRKNLALWSRLNYYTSGWRGDTNRIKKLESHMDRHVSKHVASINKEFLETTKIVFVYRNPLDQFISYFRHLQHSITDDHSYKAGKNASDIGLEDFIFYEGALDSYIKQLKTFDKVSQNFPDLILFVPYEELINNKKSALLRIIDHLGIKYDAAAFQKAMELTSLDQMIAIENKTGTSLGRDQKDPLERHIRSPDGGIGKWQSQMDPKMVQKIELIMNRHYLSLDMFYLCNDLLPKFNFLSTTSGKGTSRPRP